MDAVQEIKSRLNIEDVISEYVVLKRSGRNYKGLSPFTSEKSPSFIVSPDKQIWHDFSSGKGGDVISFIEQVEGVDFRGALEILARKAGIDLQAFSSKPNENAAQKERLFSAVAAAIKYYQKQLTLHEKPLRYLREQRGYEKQTILDFQFGFAPLGKDSLALFLKKQGFTDKELTASGLCIMRGTELVDMFRGRIMIPLHDPQGRGVGFTARQLETNTDGPKYINTPATILYDKSRQVFGLHRAKEHIRKSGFVVVVEGNLDVVASHQAGISQVVASAGTALTSYHLKSLQRFTGDIRLAFDDDRAGQEAAERTIPLAQSLGIELSLISIPAGKDPDELIKKDPELWLKTVSTPRYMIDWLIDKYAAEVDITSAQGKRQMTTKTLQIIRSLKDGVEQEHYIRLLADRTKTSFESMKNKFSEGETGVKTRLKQVKPIDQEPPNILEQRLREQHLLSIFMSAPHTREELSKLPLQILSEQARKFVEETKNLQEVDTTSEYGKMLSLLFEETYQHTDASEQSYQVAQLLRRLIEFYITNEKKTLLEKLSKPGEVENETEILTKITEIEKLRLHL